MNLSFLFFLLLIGMSSCHNQAEKNCSQKEKEAFPGISGDSLKPFTVTLLIGDEEVRKYEIRIYKKSGDYYADNITGRLFSAKLDEKKKSICAAFIKKAATLPRKCPSLISGVEDYTIVVGSDTMRITGNCDWGDLHFDQFAELIFK